MSKNKITAVLGPTNTGKTYLAIETMLSFDSGMIGFPLRLLAREVYDKIIKKISSDKVVNQLKEVTVSCKDATFKILGLSLATINIFISLIITTITIKLFLTYEKNK